MKMLSPTQMLSIKVQTKNRPVHMHMRVFFSTGLSAPLVHRLTDTNMSRHRHTSRPEPVAWLLMRTTEFTRPLNIRPKRTRFQKLAGNHILSRQCHGPIPHRTAPHGHMSPSHVLETGYLRTSRSCTWHGLRNCHTPHGSCALHTTPTRQNSTQLFDDVLSDHDHDGSHTPSIQLPTWVAVRTHVRHQKKHHTRCGYHDRERTILLNLDSGRPVAYPTSFIT